MTPPALLAEGIVALRSERVVLNEIDLRLRPGELVTIEGPSGVGKSTLLLILAGLLTAHRGQVRVTGLSLEQLSPLERAQRLAIAMQAPILPPELSVLDLVRLGRLPHRFCLPCATRKPRRQRDVEAGAIEQAIRAVGLGFLAARPLGSLSGGEQRRAHIARVLAQMTPILLLDEPTTNLDELTARVVIEELKRRADQGTAILLVTHDTAIARAHGARRLHMQDGKLLSAPERPSQSRAAP
jgi:iron complex transport system ATP-binding protein